MDKRDQELDQMLESLRGEHPTAKEMSRWQTAVAFAVKGRRYVWPALAAGLVGVVMGAAGAWNVPRNAEPCLNSHSQSLVSNGAAENLPGDATFELTYVKLD